jgi:hypothetical protein
MKLRSLHETKWGWKQRGLAAPPPPKRYQRPERDPLTSTPVPSTGGRDVAQELLDKQAATRETKILPHPDLEQETFTVQDSPEDEPESKPTAPQRSRDSTRRGLATKKRVSGRWKPNPHY